MSHMRDYIRRNPNEFNGALACNEASASLVKAPCSETNTIHDTYISLDTFREGVHNIKDELDAWLTFLIKGDAESVMKLIEAYPEFIDIYKEIAEFRRDPKELIGMFSEALLELDRNTERYMIDELKEDVEKAEAERDAAIADRDTAISSLNVERQRGDELEEKLGRYRDKFGEI